MFKVLGIYCTTVFVFSVLSGYIPRMTFKFGGTYKDDCDVCIDEYMTNKQNQEFKIRDLKQQVNSVPQLTAISRDPHVKEYLDRYRDTHPNRPLLMGKFCKRTLNNNVTFILTLVMLNKLKCHAHFYFSANQIT